MTITDFSRSTVTSPGFDLRGLRTYFRGVYKTGTSESFLALLKNVAVCPGIKNPLHTFWVFPILVEDSNEMIAALRKAGFDGASFSPSEAVTPPDDRPELDPVVTRTVLAQMVILPCYEDIPSHELAREAKIVIGKISQN